MRNLVLGVMLDVLRLAATIVYSETTKPKHSHAADWPNAYRSNKWAQ